jgi:hypothetical protein
VLRARPSSPARARVEGSRAPPPMRPSPIAWRIAPASWRDNGTGDARSSGVVHKVAVAADRVLLGMALA